MLRLFLCLLLTLQIAASLPAAEPAASGWDRVSVAPTKTSIYIGSVTLTTGVFERQGSTLSTTYAAKVFPWFFWSENGRITISLSDEELAHVAKGETAQFSGSGTNQKNKLRKVTGRAQPVDATSGKIKVRIMADGIELIFNSTYLLSDRVK